MQYITLLKLFRIGFLGRSLECPGHVAPNRSNHCLLLGCLLAFVLVPFHAHAQIVHDRPGKRTGTNTGVWNVDAAQQAASVDCNDGT